MFKFNKETAFVLVGFVFFFAFILSSPDLSPLLESKATSHIWQRTREGSTYDQEHNNQCTLTYVKPLKEQRCVILKNIAQFLTTERESGFESNF